MYTEERIGELLCLMRPTPGGWLRAAQELPAARRSLDEMVTRAQGDAEYRRRVLADLESALQGEGLEPAARLVDELRERLNGR